MREKTFTHAQRIFRQSLSAASLEAPVKEVAEVISQSDGTMVPIVEIPSGKGDGRKRRTICWKEAILISPTPSSAAATRLKILKKR